MLSAVCDVFGPRSHLVGANLMYEVAALTVEITDQAVQAELYDI